MTYIFEMMAALGVAAIFGVVKLWRDVAILKIENKTLQSELRKIDTVKLEGRLAKIETDLSYVRAFLEKGAKK